MPPYFRPNGILAGFHADRPEPAVPELGELGEQWVASTHQIPRHVHRWWELYLQLDGRSTWSSGRGSFSLAPGHLYLAPPGISHELVRKSVRHHFLYVNLDVAVVLKRHPAIDAQLWRGGRFLHHPHGAPVEPAFRHLISEAAAERPFRADGLRAAIDLLVIEVSRILCAAPGLGRGKALVTLHEGVRRAKEAIDHHPEQPWTLIELGRLAALSPNHLATRFAHDLGQSPHRYLLAARIRRAKDLLRDSDVAITDVALDLGFASSQHFAKCFRALAGVSASAWRTRSRR